MLGLVANICLSFLFFPVTMYIKKSFLKLIKKIVQELSHMDPADQFVRYNIQPISNAYIDRAKNKITRYQKINSIQTNTARFLKCDNLLFHLTQTPSTLLIRPHLISLINTTTHLILITNRSKLNQVSSFLIIITIIQISFISLTE